MENVPQNSPLRRAPQVITVAPEKLIQAEPLGSPEVRTLVGYTRRVLHLHDGHTLAVFSFSGAAQANWMFLIDSRDLSVKRVPIPHNDIGSHGATLGRDGNVYILPYGTGRAYCYDVQAGRFDPIETGLPKEEYTWEAFGASNGRIYFGTYPNAYLGEYDPTTGHCTLHKQIAPDAKYVVDFREDAQGDVWCKAWGPGETWVRYAPKTGTMTRGGTPPAPPPWPLSLPKPPEGDTAFTPPVQVDGRVFAVSNPSSRLWELRAEGAPELRADTQSPAEPWYVEAVEGAVVGISHYGAVFRYDLKTEKLSRKQLPNRAAGGNPIMFLEALTPRCVIGANYSQQNLFKIDPETGKIATSEQMIASVTGEAMCAVGFQGRGYLGIYVRSVLSVYYPKRKFAPGVNPRELMTLGMRYHQTRPRAAVTDGKLVYISSDSDYTYLGGALVVIDPATDKIDVYHHLIRDQNLPSLAYDPTTKLLWGGTDRWGQMRSHPPTQPSALLYAFDPATRQVAATLTPWPGADTATVLGVSADGILIATNGEEIALIHTPTREILYKGKMSGPLPGRVRVGQDGAAYCLAGGTLCRWDFPQNTLTPVAVTPGCVFLTEASPGTWAVANSAQIYRVRLARRTP